ALFGLHFDGPRDDVLTPSSQNRHHGRFDSKERKKEADMPHRQTSAALILPGMAGRGAEDEASSGSLEARNGHPCSSQEHSTPWSARRVSPDNSQQQLAQDGAPC